MNSIDNPKQKPITITRAKQICKELRANYPNKYPRPGREVYLGQHNGYEIYLVNSAGRLYLNWHSVFNRAYYNRSVWDEMLGAK